MHRIKTKGRLISKYAAAFYTDIELFYGRPKEIVALKEKK
jgi:hypothetical protein